jgi:sugar lactone lactonase YvrE
VYVSNVLSFSPPYTGAVNYYAVGSNGNVAPSAVISGSNTALTLVNGIAVDNSGEIYVANSDTNSIVGFAPGSSGNVTPNVVISGSDTGLASPIGMTIDSAGNIYFSNCGTDCSWGPPGATSVEEFAAGSNGDASPKRLIARSRTKLSGNTNGIAVDRRGFVYVALAGPNEVNVYHPRASGNVTPVRVLSGKETHITNPDGVAFGRFGLYVTSSDAARIGLFPRRVAGDAAPFSTIRADWSKGGQQILGGMAAGSDDTVYVTGFSVPLVAQYSGRGRSRRSPLTVISGSNTDLVLPTFVFAR